MIKVWKFNWQLHQEKSPRLWRLRKFLLSLLSYISHTWRQVIRISDASIYVANLLSSLVEYLYVKGILKERGIWYKQAKFSDRTLCFIKTNFGRSVQGYWVIMAIKSILTQYNTIFFKYRQYALKVGHKLIPQLREDE